MQKNDASLILEELREHGITKFYHFTDRDNLQSIVDNGGLYSWYYCEQNNIQIAKPGGNYDSRQLDRRDGHHNYVRVSFTRNHPMMYVALNEGRISNPVILEISLDVAAEDSTLFSDRNAVKNGAKIGGTLSDLRNIHFSTVKARTHFDVDEDERMYFQAELLVREFIPLSMITNIADFGVVMSKPQAAAPSSPKTSTTPSASSQIQLHVPYTAMISRETPTAFIFLVDHSVSMRNMTNLYGQQMTCAQAVAQILNAQIAELVNRCIKLGETRHYYDIAVIGYGKDVYSAWSGTLSGRSFVTPAELEQNPQKVITVKKAKKIRGKEIVTELEQPQWFEPRCDGSRTHGHKAFKRAYELAEQWIQSHDARCYPPTIINITDGQFNGADKETHSQLASEIKSLYTSDGNVLLFNVHITPAEVESIAFPASREELGTNKYASELFEWSSLLPETYNEKIANLFNIPVTSRLSAMAVNTDMQQLIKIMDIGTPTNIRQQ